MTVPEPDSLHASEIGFGRMRRISARIRPIWVAIVLALVGFGTSTAVTLLHSDALSPLDEWVYVDYLYKVPEQGMVFKGEAIGDEALDAIACDGVTPYGTMGDPCGSEYDYANFPFGGVTSADPYPPIFFMVTRFLGDGIGLLAGVDDVTGWRLTGPLWLAATMVAFFALLRSWRVHSIAILALGLAFIGSPFAYWTYSYVSTDAPAFLCGSLLLYLTTRYVRGEVRGWWIVGMAAVAAVFKVTNLLGVGLAALLLLIDALRTAHAAGWSFRGRPLVTAGFAGLSLAAGVVVQGGWLYINEITAVSTERAAQGIGRPFGVEELLAQTTNFLPGTIVSNVVLAGSGGQLALPFPGFATAPLSWICIAGVIGAFFRLAGPWSERSSLVVAVTASAALAGPALAIALQIATSSYFTLPARYGATLLPAFLLMAGLLMRNRWASAIVGLYGLGLAAALIYGSYLLGRI